MNFLFNVNFWGERYTRFFLDYSLPSQLAAGNIPYMLRHNQGAIKYRIYTTREDAVLVVNSPVYVKLCKLVETEIIDLDTFDLYNHHNRGTMTLCHADAIQYANANNYSLLFIWPDIIFSYNSLGTLFKLALSGKTSVFVPSLAVHTGNFLQELGRRYVLDNGALTIPPREMVAIGVKTPCMQSLQWKIDSPHFNTCSPWIFWDVPGEGILQRAFHMTPMLLTPDDKSVQLDYDPRDELGLDGNAYLSKAMRDISAIAVVCDSDDFLCASLNDEILPVIQNRFRAIDVANFARRILLPHHYSLFSNKVRFHYTELSLQWDRVEGMSDNVVNDILTMLQRTRSAPKKSNAFDGGVAAENQAVSQGANRRILFISLEFPLWKQARSWSYTANMGIEEGFSANGVSFVTVPVLYGLWCWDPASWLCHLKDICSGKQFDQVWIEVVHNYFDNRILSYIETLAPVRLAIIAESLTYPDEIYTLSPDLRNRQEEVVSRLKYMTHALVGDEKDSEWLNNRHIIKALWWVQAIPERVLCSSVRPSTTKEALFTGAMYGVREQWLYHPALKGLLVHQKPLEEDAHLPELFDQTNTNIITVLKTGNSFSEELLARHVDLLRTIRRQSFALWLKGLTYGSAVVNLPSFFQSYAGRVYEGMASGQPVISWRIPDRPRVNSLFEDGRDILLFSKDDPEQLAEQIRRVQSDPEFAEYIATNARNKIITYHTMEKRVAQIINWIYTGDEPDYGEYPSDLKIEHVYDNVIGGTMSPSDFHGNTDLGSLADIRECGQNSIDSGNILDAISIYNNGVHLFPGEIDLWQQLRRLALLTGDADTARNATSRISCISSDKRANEDNNSSYVCVATLPDGHLSLTELMKTGQYETDKTGYIPVYDDLFSGIRTKNIKLLEIGIFKGGSLKLWRDYFVNGTVVGLDLMPVQVPDTTGRLKTYQGSQDDTKLLDLIALEQAPNGFDVIIDDASHIGELTRKSFWHLFENHLNSGGMYIIEDWGTGYWPSFVDGQAYQPGFPHTAGMVGFVKELIDECAMPDITKPGLGSGIPCESKIRSMSIYNGLVIIIKC